MLYREIIIEQINRVRQARNDDLARYPQTVETLWLLLQSEKIQFLIKEKKRELGIQPSYMVDYLDIEQWDNIFKFTLENIPIYEGVSL